MKALFEDSIYPTQNEYKEATENYFKIESPDFYKKFKKNQWISFFERNIYQSVSQAILRLFIKNSILIFFLLALVIS